MRVGEDKKAMTQSEAIKKIRSVMQQHMEKTGYTYEDAKKLMDEYKNGR
ncbi:hypothetical protein [Bacillus sp. BA3]|nr:hypothetical protein [Bacillus sp. BA3]